MSTQEILQLRRRIIEVENRNRVNMADTARQCSKLTGNGSTLNCEVQKLVANVNIEAPNIEKIEKELYDNQTGLKTKVSALDTQLNDKETGLETRLANHNHDSTYVNLEEYNSHNHDSTYVNLEEYNSHNHDSSYVKLEEYNKHNHDSSYVKLGVFNTHKHDNDYAPKEHNHNDLYYSKQDIETALSGKADSVHYHSDLVEAINRKAASDHEHEELEKELNFCSAWINTFGVGWDGNKYQTDLANHTHDTRYYTEGEVDAKLSGKADSEHNHDTAYYTKQEVNTALSGKAESLHNHDSDYSPLGHTHDYSPLGHTHTIADITDINSDTFIIPMGTYTAENYYILLPLTKNYRWQGQLRLHRPQAYPGKYKLNELEFEYLNGKLTVTNSRCLYNVHFGGFSTLKNGGGVCTYQEAKYFIFYGIGVQWRTDDGILECTGIGNVYLKDFLIVKQADVELDAEYVIAKTTPDQDRITACETDIGDLETAVSDLETEFNDHTHPISKITDLADTLANKEERLAQAEEDIDTLEGKINTEQTGIEPRLQVCEKWIAAYQAPDGYNDTALSNRITKCETDISELKTADSNLSDKIDTEIQNRTSFTDRIKPMVVYENKDVDHECFWIKAYSGGIKIGFKGTKDLHITVEVEAWFNWTPSGGVEFLSNAGELNYVVRTNEIGINISGSYNIWIMIDSNGENLFDGIIDRTVDLNAIITYKDLIDIFYPVGSIYTSLDVIDMNDKFPGTTWEEITNRFLYASYVPGQTGGEAEHTLTIAEMPKHNHDFTITRPAHTDGYPDGWDDKNGSGPRYWYGVVEPNVGTTTAGYTQPHNNMPPYLTVLMWKRIA